MDHRNLIRSLHAIDAYYEKRFAPKLLPREQLELKQRQILRGFYEGLAEIEVRLAAMEASFGHVHVKAEPVWTPPVIVTPDGSTPEPAAGGSGLGLGEGTGHGGYYNPDQPRVPAGNPDGGQWTDAYGSEDDTTYHGDPDEPIEPVYPLENILGLLTGTEAISAIRSMAAGRAAVRASSRRVQQAARSIEDFFGGRPQRTFRNDDDDLIMMSGDKKVRFDIEGKHGYDEHFHIQKQAPNGRWEDATEQHIYFFRKD